MDKPSQTKLYAGLVIYRIQRNVEYLLLNDSFTNKKHWFCPKGQVIGNEDEIKCALRETFETTGLRPSELRIEEGFTIELKYLSGTKPKKVQYHLAQLLDNHVRLLPNAEGVHMQWYNQSACSEKVIFKSMQDVFKHAQTFIESKQQRRKHFDQPRMMGRPTLTETKSSTVEEIKLKSRPTAAPAVTTAPVVPVPAQQQSQQQSQQPQQQQQQQQTPSPLYKTRLCERYETEGVCPYGPKCNFAHGVLELRGKEQETTVPIPTTVPANQMMDAGNQLFKTRLCEKFIKEKFCQYGPKCHFAHGESELKIRPKKPEEAEPVTQLRPRSFQQQQQQQQQNINVETDQRTNWRHDKNNSSSHHPNETSWRSNEYRTRSSSEEDEVAPKGRSNRESSWRSTSPKTPPPTMAPPPIQVMEEEMTRPVVFVEQRTPPITKKATTPKEKKTMVAPVTTEKSWMKVLKLSKEEQDEMESNAVQQKTVIAPAKSAQTELIITELKKFFTNNVATVAAKGKLMQDVKEVTKIEMRNDLSKKQLLYILLVCLLEDTDSLLPILKSRDHLFKTLVKTNADQILLLKAWETFVTQRKPIMVNKTAVALSHWYDCEMVEEEAFVQWYDTLQKASPLETKSAKFIEWLNASDEEEDE